MKKSLSLLLAIALVFGMFSAMASAATPSTPAEAGKLLQELNVLKGDGKDLLENDIWKRQDIVVLLARLLGKEEAAAATAKSHTFADVKGTYYDGFLSWAKEEKYINGYSDTKFGYDDQLTVKDFAAIVLRALGTNNDATVAEDAVKAGIFAEGTDFAAKAKRGDTFVALVAGLSAEVAGTGKTLGAILGLKGFETAELAVAKIAQSGAKKITVDFNRALTADEAAALKVEVKNGTVPFPVTVKVADDKKSAVLESTYLPAQEYDVTVNAFAAVKVTVVAEKATKIDIGATALQKAAGQDLAIKVLNQFNEDITKTVSGLTTKVISSKNGDLDAKLSAGKVDLSGEDVDNTIIVTVTHAGTGLVASKTFKVVAGSSATNIVVGAVAPVGDDTRIYTDKDKDYVLPLTLKDQYGNEFKLANGTASAVYGVYQIGGISFVSSDNAIINPASFKVEDGVVKFRTGSKAGVVVLTVSNFAAAGATATVTINVEAPSSLKTFQLSNPSSIIVDGEDVTFPYVAADSFGAAMANKDVPAAADKVVNGGKALRFYVGNGEVFPKWKANGDLLLNFSGTGTKVVTVHVNGSYASQITIDVKAVAEPVSIDGVKDLKTTIAVGGTQEIKAGNLIVRDQYARTMGSDKYSISSIVYDGGTGANASLAGAVVTGIKKGTEKIKVTVAGKTRVIEFAVIEAADVKSVVIGTAGTVYGYNTNTAGSDHAVTLSLTGKTEAGTEVAIKTSDYFNLVTSSDESIVALEASNSLKIYGKAEGTAVVTVWKNGTKLSEQTVTVSKVAPFVSSVKFKDADVTLTGAIEDTLNISGKLEVKDQYGVAKADSGFWYTSNDKVVTVANGVLTKKAARGTATVTYVSANGLSATINVTVE